MSQPVVIGNATLKKVTFCRACHWTWKPSTGATREACPQCAAVRDVRARKYPKTNVPQLKAWRAKRPGYANEWERRYRRRAVLLVGRGVLSCVRCGCDRVELLEINHKNGGGGKELRGLGSKWHRMIAKLERSVDDLELLCRPCNAVHALELIHGPLPYRIVWVKK